MLPAEGRWERWYVLAFFHFPTRRANVRTHSEALMLAKSYLFRQFACSIALGASTLCAQIDRAVLEGTVNDPSGRVIVGANVRITAVDTGITQELQTNGNGYYRFPGLPIGRYNITISSQNFTTKAIQA